MQIATWNVNSLNVRLPHVQAWLEKTPVDVLALQETKLTDDKFPVDALLEAGYHAVFNGQKTYNGVALLSRQPAEDVVHALPGFEDDAKRVIAGTVDGTRVIGVYCPNGKDIDNPSYTYKLEWFAALATWLADELTRHDRLVLTGDFNIAPRPCDTYDADKWEGRILCSEPERAALQTLLDAGLTDLWPLFEADKEGRHCFTWWDYRHGGWARNAGLRIDHVLASSALRKVCTGCKAHVGERGRKRPSDHVPVVAEFDLG
ncbi:exodeoxyribonuclease III [Salinisphaera sp.]|uniref:exodeoxyribonuclease III n=1 Tax=Salinisphaera sp. TaxID=1914330 RepID=UPI000C467D45|nr:exodeoxyribonuclease III [Salinisphaera sp.]MAS08633.1 exodeoxyribonuclease III [Salinisphaera sp.]|tara:strand:+ start:109 stop:888 length:780 start_codon:yes stop_codon:yes gene_type:complete